MKLEKATAIQALQDLMLKGKEKDGFYGDGKSIATIPDVPIKHSFADQLYIRQMDLKKGFAQKENVEWFILMRPYSVRN